MAGILARELQRLLEALDARIEVQPPRDRPDLRALFCLALSSRRKAVKPVERLSARIQWAKLALGYLDQLEVRGREPAPAPSPGGIPRNLGRRGQLR